MRLIRSCPPILTAFDTFKFILYTDQHDWSLTHLTSHISHLRWEWSLEEFQRDLTEAFVWTVFEEEIEVDSGKIMNRKDWMHPRNIEELM